MTALINKTKYNILSIDLGTSLGLAYSILNTASGKLVINDTSNINIDKYIKEYNLDIQTNTTKIARQIAFSRILYNYVVYHSSDIDIFIVEDIFLNPRLANAYMVLSLYMNKLEEFVNLKFHTSLIKIAPRYIKKSFSGIGGAADKNHMLTALQNQKDILFLNHVKIEKLSEHEIDAIAVVSTYVKQLKHHQYI